MLRWYVPHHEWSGNSVWIERGDTPLDGFSLSLSPSFFFIYRRLGQRYFIGGCGWIAMEDWLLSRIRGCGSEQPTVHPGVNWLPEIYSCFGGHLFSPTRAAPSSGATGTDHNPNAVTAANLHSKCAEYRKGRQAQRKLLAVVLCCI